MVEYNEQESFEYPASVQVVENSAVCEQLRGIYEYPASVRASSRVLGLCVLKIRCAEGYNQVPHCVCR